MCVSFADLLGKIVEWLICQKCPFWARRLQYTSVPRQMRSIPPPNMSISGHHVAARRPGSEAPFSARIPTLSKKPGACFLFPGLSHSQ